MNYRSVLSALAYLSNAVPVPILALVIARITLPHVTTNAGWLSLFAVSVGVVLLGLYDWFQTRWTLTRNYPVAARIRWLFYDLRPFLHAYIVEDDLGGKPYSFEARNLVHARARGETDTHPFGTERDTQSAEHMCLNHSIAPATACEKHPRIRIRIGILPISSRPLG